MYKNIDFTRNGGLYVYQDTLAFLQTAYSSVLDGLAAGYGPLIIVSGCEDNGVQVGPGLMVINGEFVPFEGGNKPSNPLISILGLMGTEQFDNGDMHPVYSTRTAQIGVLGDYNYNDFVRLDNGVFGSINEMQTIVKRAVNLDPSVIISGCVVTNVNSGDLTLDISAGEVFINGKLYKVPSFSGNYPVYLSATGWNNSNPGGDVVLFDPYTSQYYKDVLRRATTPVDEIKLFKTKSGSFNADGTGKWDMKGFRLCSELQSRVPVGLWFDGTAVANVTDANYTGAGNTGGWKQTTLSQANIPAMNVSIPTTGYAGISGSSEKFVAHSNTPIAPDITLNFGGDNTPFNNLQPYTIVVYAIRY